MRSPSLSLSSQTSNRAERERVDPDNIKINHNELLLSFYFFERKERGGTGTCGGGYGFGSASLCFALLGGVGVLLFSLRWVGCSLSGNGIIRANYHYLITDNDDMIILPSVDRQVCFSKIIIMMIIELLSILIAMVMVILSSFWMVE